MVFGTVSGDAHSAEYWRLGCSAGEGALGPPLVDGSLEKSDKKRRICFGQF
jgi:hypothetical protein